MPTLIPRQGCLTMRELLIQIDKLGLQLIGMLVMCAGYIDRASSRKSGEGSPARSSERVEEVV